MSTENKENDTINETASLASVIEDTDFSKITGGKVTFSTQDNTPTKVPENNEVLTTNDEKEFNNDEDDDDDDDEYKDETEDDMLTCLFSPFSFTKNSDLYVVSVDRIPRFYVKDEKTASEKMWDIARRLSGNRFMSGYRTHFLKINDSELHLLGTYQFFLVSYDTLLHRISYSKVQECV